MGTDHITEILILSDDILDYVSVYLFWNRIQFSEKLSVRSFDRSTIIGGSFLLSIMPVQFDQGLMLPMESLGSVGIFPCMVLAIFGVEVLRFCKTKRLCLKCRNKFLALSHAPLRP